MLKSLLEICTLGLVDFDFGKEKNIQLSYGRRSFVSYAGIYANMIQNLYGNDNIPVNPVLIANKLDLEVFEQKNLEVKSYLDKKKNEIVFDMGLSRIEQRYRVAHELGHLLLKHNTSVKSPIGQYSIVGYMDNEIEADCFARNLLVPDQLISYFVYNTNLSYSEILRKLDVEEQIYIIRLREFGIAI